MKLRLLIVALGLFFFSFHGEISACTSAIFTGKTTKDGRPLMWKHRDTGEENNRIEFFQGPKYYFYALVNSPLVYTNNQRLCKAWAGTNNVGFSIMNTASYNLKDDDVPDKQMNREGSVMFEALGKCRTLADFEKMLDEYKRPIGVESNFGVIDAEGGAAYYEVNNNSWKKIDVNDPNLAPQGYMVHTNHSYTGRFDDGKGYIRYTAADNIIKSRIAQAGYITPEWIYKSLSREFYHPVLDIDLIKNNNIIQQGSGWFIDQDFIPRKSSTASVVFEGVLKGENPLHTIMWTVLGYPPVGVAVPLWVSAKEEGVPSFMKAQTLLPDKKSEGIKGNEDKNKLYNSPLCDLVLRVKSDIFSIKRGSGSKYMNFNLIWSPDGKGWMQKLEPIEDYITSNARKLIKTYRDNNKLMPIADLSSYYSDIWNIIQEAYN